MENQLFIGEYQWEIGKVGIDSPGGWIAYLIAPRNMHSRSNLLTIQRKNIRTWVPLWSAGLREEEPLEI